MEYSPHMETIQVVLDKELLHATDKVARRLKANRSALVRDALREHLRRLEIRAKEDTAIAKPTSSSRRTKDEAQLWHDGGIVAGRIARGDVRLYQFDSPDKQRPVVVLTRDTAIEYLGILSPLRRLLPNFEASHRRFVLTSRRRNEDALRRESSQRCHGEQEPTWQARGATASHRA